VVVVAHIPITTETQSAQRLHREIAMEYNRFGACRFSNTVKA
jgi:hypothetical protein